MRDCTPVTVDPVARAYATIGLRPGASARALKEQYRKLAKTWHPDRWANDTASQAEAAQRMRAINDAYATLHRVRTVARSGNAEASTPTHSAEHWSTSHRTLDDEELDAIVRAIGSDSYFKRAIRSLAWMLPMAGALVVIQPSRSADLVAVGPNERDLIIGAVLFSVGVFAFLYQMTKHRKP